LQKLKIVLKIDCINWSPINRMDNLEVVIFYYSGC